MAGELSEVGVGLATAGGRPAAVVGMHVTGGGQDIRLVEVVSTVPTAPDVAATAHAVCSRSGVPSVGCTARAGFLVEALPFPYLDDAVRMLEAGYATADDIDAAMTLGCGYPQGPVEALDRVGLDVAPDVLRAIHAEVREPGYAPAPLRGHLVTAGRLGRGTGRGFRDPAAVRG